MKKFKRAISVICLGSLLLSATSLNVGAVDSAKTDTSPQLYTSDSEAQTVEISRDEYLQIMARNHGITVEEAAKLDAANTAEAIASEQQRIANSRAAGVTVSPRDTVYRMVSQTYTVGSAGDFFSKIKMSAVVKGITYYETGYGDYLRFTSSEEVSILPSGSGSYRWESGLKYGYIDGDWSHGNYFKVMITGNMEHTVNHTLSASASAAGFVTAGSSVGTSVIMRKFYEKQDSFSSNSYLVK